MKKFILAIFFTLILIVGFSWIMVAQRVAGQAPTTTAYPTQVPNLWEIPCPSGYIESWPYPAPDDPYQRGVLVYCVDQTATSTARPPSPTAITLTPVPSPNATQARLTQTAFALTASAYPTLQLTTTHIPPSRTPTVTYTVTRTSTITASLTPSETPTETATETDTATLTPTETDTPTLTPSETATSSPTATETPTETPTETNTPSPTATAAPPTLTPTWTVMPTETPIPIIAPVVDHNSLALFDELKINNPAIDAARLTSAEFFHASVGANLSFGLDCLADNEAAYINGHRRSACGNYYYDRRFDRSNFIFPLFTAGGWQGKTAEFYSVVSNQAPHLFDWTGFKFCYLEGLPGSGVVSGFYNGSPSVGSLASLNGDHPLYWVTMALARVVGTQESRDYNNELRAFVTANRYPLFDVADIESHAPDGSACELVDASGNRFPIICREYTNEISGGHLNALGSARLAQAWWVFMAELAGWRP